MPGHYKPTTTFGRVVTVIGPVAECRVAGAEVKKSDIRGRQPLGRSRQRVFRPRPVPKPLKTAVHTSRCSKIPLNAYDGLIALDQLTV